MPLVRSKKAKISLERAQQIEGILYHDIHEFCWKWCVVGSIRRHKPEINDIDILIIPRVGGLAKLAEWGKNLKNGDRVIKMGKTGMQLLYRGVQVDLYFATPETWVTLMVIRTGSVEHNIKLCQKAKSMGLVLHADGRGIFTKESSKLKTDSEEEFFNQLGLTYLKPEERD